MLSLVFLLSVILIMRPGARNTVARAAPRAGFRRAPLRSAPARKRRSLRGSSGARYAVTLRKMPNLPQPSPRSRAGPALASRTAAAAAGRHRPRSPSVRFGGRPQASGAGRAIFYTNVIADGSPLARLYAKCGREK